MQKEIYDIKVPYEKLGLSSEGNNPKLSAFVIDVSPELGNKNRPAVIICPGGGYEFVSDREAEFVALRYAGYGIHAFILRYSVVKKQFPTALLELAASVAFVRNNAEKWDINPNKIFVTGFSAGGHLAASLSTFWNHDFIKDSLDFFNNEHKPNGAILCYPVITSNEYRHEGSIINIINDDNSDEMLELVSLEKQVSSDTPATFLWHTADDGCVPVENSLLFMTALSKNKIPFEAHIFEQGHHGLSLCDETTAAYDGHINPNCSQWFDMAVNWIKRQ